MDDVFAFEGAVAYRFHECTRSSIIKSKTRALRSGESGTVRSLGKWDTKIAHYMYVVLTWIPISQDKVEECATAFVGI